MTVDAKGLLRCLDYSFTESICLQVLSMDKVEVNVKLLVQLYQELPSKL